MTLFFKLLFQIKNKVKIRFNLFNQRILKQDKKNPLQLKQRNGHYNILLLTHFIFIY